MVRHGGRRSVRGRRGNGTGRVGPGPEPPVGPGSSSSPRPFPLPPSRVDLVRPLLSPSRKDPVGPSPPPEALAEPPCPVPVPSRRNGDRSTHHPGSGSGCQHWEAGLGEGPRWDGGVGAELRQRGWSDGRGL